jgi:hypothetical protein
MDKTTLTARIKAQHPDLVTFIRLAQAEFPGVRLLAFEDGVVRYPRKAAARKS